MRQRKSEGHNDTKAVKAFRGFATRAMTPDDMNIRGMTRDELDVLVEWAAREGWNPGLDDAEVFWATDPEGFVAAEIDGELIGGGSIVAYGKKYGFLGFFIVRPEYRGHGFGDDLWHELNRRLLARLDPDSAIGLDGVFNMQNYYASGGFRFVCRDLRFEGVGMGLPQPKHVTEASALPFDCIESYDRRHFPASRGRFLRGWLNRPGGHSLAVVDGGEIRGYAVMRPCRYGYKIGPLFAANTELAESLLVAVASRVPGQPIFLDVPEINTDALALVVRYGMREVFGCARMVFGPIPELPDAEIFGVTTFELG